MFYIGNALGALIPTFLLGRLMMYLMREHKPQGRRIAVANVFALLCSVLLAGFGSGEGGFGSRVETMLSPRMIVAMLIAYAPAQAVWALVDVWRIRRQQLKQGSLAFAHGEQGSPEAQEILKTGDQESGDTAPDKEEVVQLHDPAEQGDADEAPPK